MNAIGRIRTFLPSALLTALALATPPAAAADLAGKAYLARVAAFAQPDVVTVHLRIRGAAVPAVAYRPGLVQVTLEDAFLDPARQRVPVDHPAVSEVLAYQLDPDTVRVRVLTPGLDARDLADTTVLTPEPGGLRLVLRGLPAPQAAPEPAAAAPATAPPVKRPAPVAVARAEDAPDPAPADTLAEENLDATGPGDPADTADASTPFQPAATDPVLAAAEARTRALEAFEQLLSKDGAGEPARPVPPNEVAWLAGVRPDAPQGGGSPALPEPPPAVSEAAPTHPAPAAPPAPEADAAEAPAAPAARAPLLPLPGGEGAPSLLTSGLKMAGGLFTVLALLLAGMTLLRRVRGTAFGGNLPIRVLASASVGGRQNIVVVEVEGRRLVVGVGPAGMELLADLAQAAPVAGAPGTGPAGSASVPAPAPGRGDTRFARVLKAAGRRPDPADPQAEAVARATRDLARHVRRLRERAV